MYSMANIFDTTTTINTLLKSFTFFKRGDLAILFVILIHKKEKRKKKDNLLLHRKHYFLDCNL